MTKTPSFALPLFTSLGIEIDTEVLLSELVNS
jgi:hypothetical protein